MLYADPPARIADPGTYPFAEMGGGEAVYTVGRDFVLDAMKDVFRRTRSIACDIETYGLGRLSWRLKCVQFGDERAAVIMDPRDPVQAAIIRHTFSHATELTFWNSAFDVVVLYLNGLITLADVAKVFDPLLHARLAEPDERVSKNLLEAANRYFPSEAQQTDVLRQAFKALGLSSAAGYYQMDLDRPLYLQGAAADPLVTARIRPLAREKAYARTTSGHPFTTMGVTGAEAERLLEREQIVNRMLLRRACRGLRVDFEYLDRYREHNATVVREAEEALTAQGVRPGVGGDLMKVLEELGAVPETHPRTGKTNALSTQAKHLEQIAHPLARAFVDLKKITKVGSDYLQKCVDLADDDGRVHPTANVLVAATGRASMGDPPLHQFSGPARGILLADEGDSLASIDWSTIEPITTAYAAKDEKVITQWESGQGVDLYCLIGILAGLLPAGTTKAMCEAKDADGNLVNPKWYWLRKVLKVVLLAQMYGEGLPKLTADLGLDPGPMRPPTQWEVEKMGYRPDRLYPDYAEAKRYRANIFSAMPGTKELIDKLKMIARDFRKVFTVSGRILTVPSVGGRAMAHKGVNYFVQGSAYDVMAESLVAVEEAGLGDALYLTMHDELVVSSSAAHDIRKIMQTPPERLTWMAGRTPVLRTDLAELGERWAA